MIDPVELFKCLSDPTRLYATLLVSREGELCVCELMVALEQSQPKISRHLAYLRAGSVLHATRREQWMYYSLADELPGWAREILQVAQSAHADQLNAMLHKLRGMENRPQCC